MLTQNPDNTDARLLNENDKQNLAIFMSFMATRVPRTIDAVRETGEALQLFSLKELIDKPEELNKIIDIFKKEGKISKNITVDKLIDDLKNFENRYHICLNKKYATGISLLTTSVVLEELMNMNWCILRAPSRKYFITSDNPLVCFVLNRDGSAVIGSGFRLFNAQISFPLSPFKALFLDRKHSHKYRAISDKTLIDINKRTAWLANKIIISTFKNSYLDKLNMWASESLKYPKVDKNKLYEDYKRKGF